MKLANLGLAIFSLGLGIFVIGYSLVRPSLSLNVGLMIGVALLLNGSFRIWLHKLRRK